LFNNDNDKSKNALKVLYDKLVQNGFEISEEDYNIAIAIGGDGSFLRMIKETKFNSDVLYIGVNAGTLGFTQEVLMDDIDEFINDLINDTYKVDSIGIQETKVITSTLEAKFYSLNEIVIREKNLNTMFINVEIDDNFLEQFVGDGLLITTSFGSTAYNLSFGGSIIYNTFHSLQITPIAPINNKSYRNLLNSIVIPENKVVTLTPSTNKNNLLITADGENIVYDDVLLIKTYINKKRIKCFRRKDYDFSKRINEKFLK
ncbi:MAG: NAD(+)/NADH kinase, partial [Bacilli bacterium]